jgi:hypothetical protein
MAQSDLSSRYVAPVAVLASVAVAVGVWLAPTGWLDPERRTNDADEPRPPEAVAPTPTGGQTQRRPDWIVLGEALSLVRDPVVVPNEPETPAEEDPGAAEAPETAETRPASAAVRVPWEYLGLVDQAERAAALVRVGGLQRFVFEGEMVEEPSLDGREVEVVRVEPDTLHLRVGETEFTLDRVGRTEGEATPGATQQADRPTPPGQRDPRRRR